MFVCIASGEINSGFKVSPLPMLIVINLVLLMISPFS